MRHAVGQEDGTGIGEELGFQDEREVAVSAANLAHLAGRGEQPSAMFRRAEQGGKTGPESKRGRHSQSIEPSRSTSAAVWPSPIRA
jgi:hypothetical protein